MSPRAAALWRNGTLAAAGALWLALLWAVWTLAPDWSLQSDVSAPLTRRLLFFHPPAAWASFAAYTVVLVFSILVLRSRDLRHDQPAQAAAEVGFTLNTVALATGTVWGMQEWSRSGQSSLATVYTEPKVLMVLVLWATFAGYLMLRRLVDSPDRRARLAAVFGVLGAFGVPASIATSRVLSTSLHPDITGPGANPDAAVGATIGWLLALGAAAFLALGTHLWLQRLRILRAEARLAALEDETWTT